MNKAQQIEKQDLSMKRLNGVDLDTLMGTVNAIQADPELGISKFRARNTWMDGNHNRSMVAGFYAAKQEIAHAQTFTMDADEPAILAGGDQAANPVEHLLHALASCLTTSIVAHAAVRGIEIEELESELEGDIDLNGFLGLDAKTPKGFTEIRARFMSRQIQKTWTTSSNWLCSHQCSIPSPKVHGLTWTLF